MLQDAWAKITPTSSLIADGYEKEVSVTQSGLDGVLFMEVGEDEVFRRANNRKIDPQTNIVYHMEDNPPEETKDNKLIERLQPYRDEAGNTNRIA